MNECLTTPQHKNKSATGCETNGIFIKRFTNLILNHFKMARTEYK